MNSDYIEDVNEYTDTDNTYKLADKEENHVYVFTTSSLLDLLSQITELQNYDISIQEVDGDVYLHVGESTYKLNFNDAENIEVTDDVIEDIQDANADGFDQIPDLVTTEDSATVKSGIIASLLKDIALGGMVRFGNKLLQKDK